MKICRVVPILDTVYHMTNYTWIGPVVIVNLILFFNSWYSWSCDYLHLARQDVIFKAILGKVDHMTNCTWIGPAIIVNSILFASYCWYSWSCDHG